MSGKTGKVVTLPSFVLGEYGWVAFDLYLDWKHCFPPRLWLCPLAQGGMKTSIPLARDEAFTIADALDDGASRIADGDAELDSMDVNPDPMDWSPLSLSRKVKDGFLVCIFHANYGIAYRIRFNAQDARIVATAIRDGAKQLPDATTPTGSTRAG